MLILAGLATKSMARAIIASTYIRQLRSGLPRCCLHGRSRRRDGAHLLNGILASANLRCGLIATHPTCPTHPTGVERERRTTLEWVTDFPDDQIEDGCKIVQPGGRAVACAVSDLLKDAGMITSIPKLDYEHGNGWEFDAAQDGRKYWLLVTDLADTMLIQTKDISPFWRVSGRKAHYVRFLNDLHRLLCQDKRFRSVNFSSP